jgi:Fe2+ or Zn2+ uptake regulation protein
MRTPDELTTLFHSRGLRVTPQRQRIFQILAESSTHPTADSVYARIRQDMPTISLKTVYDVLNELVELGEIQQLDFGEGARRFDPTTAQHHHLLCERCGKVRDIFADFSQVQIPSDQGLGFRIRNAEVTFRGFCDQCAQSGPAGQPAMASEPATASESTTVEQHA